MYDCYHKQNSDSLFMTHFTVVINVTSIELFMSIPVSVTLVEFGGHSSVRKMKLTVVVVTGLLGF